MKWRCKDREPEHKVRTLDETVQESPHQTSLNTLGREMVGGRTEV